MALRFGSEEKMACLQAVRLRGADGEDLCIAHKYTITWVGAGAWVSDDGYVLRVVDRDAYYPIPEPADLQAMQEAGTMPEPFPPYSIPVIDYIFGYSLWIVLALVAIGSVIGARRRKQVLAEDAAAPVTTGPPVLSTKVDRYIAEETGKLLRATELVQHQAYAYDRDPASKGLALGNAYFAVLTNERLILIKARIGAFSIMRENRGVETFERADIELATRVDDDQLMFRLAGQMRPLWVQRDKGGVSNQAAFLRDVPRLLFPTPPSDRSAGT